MGDSGHEGVCAEMLPEEVVLNVLCRLDRETLESVVTAVPFWRKAARDLDTIPALRKFFERECNCIMEKVRERDRKLVLFQVEPLFFCRNGHTRDILTHIDVRCSVMVCRRCISTNYQPKLWCTFSRSSIRSHLPRRLESLPGGAKPLA